MSDKILAKVNECPRVVVAPLHFYTLIVCGSYVDTLETRPLEKLDYECKKESEDLCIAVSKVCGPYLDWPLHAFVNIVINTCGGRFHINNTCYMLSAKQCEILKAYAEHFVALPSLNEKDVDVPFFLRQVMTSKKPSAMGPPGGASFHDMPGEKAND
jgi:hypothetical protein